MFLKIHKTFKSFNMGKSKIGKQLKDHNAVRLVRLKTAAFGLESSTLPLSHCTPCIHIVVFLNTSIIFYLPDAV